MKDLGPLHYFLGIAVTRTADGFFLSQSKYADELLERANMQGCKPAPTPVDTRAKLSASDGALISDASEYRNIVGALQYMTMTRPDITYAVQQCCLVMHDLRDVHRAPAKRILHYLCDTSSHGLHLRRSGSLDLVAYSDADWAGCPDTCRSTSGYAVYLDDSLVSWSSKRQATVSRSSAEAEYCAVANAVAESCWIRQLLGELVVPLPRASVIFCDNISSVYMAANPVHHRRTKHIELDIHFVREKVALGELRVLHVPTSNSSPTCSPKDCPWILPSSSMPRYERDDVAPSYADDCASGMSIAQRWFLAKERCTVLAIRSCVEWEPETFPLVEALLGKPVVPLGLLPPSADGGRRRAAGSSEDHVTLRWLEEQPPDSVVYIALGSEVPLSVEQVHELALGLELAGTRFLWALRKPAGAVLDNDDALPPGFQDRTRGHGVVTMGWVPQISILAHAAVGAFLTHCGRNSLIEGLLFGHPLVMLPIFSDQGPNARQMEAKKVGLQVARDDDDGSFDRHGVAAAVRTVMLDGEARRGFVAGALKMQAIVADKERHERYIDEFVQQLRSYLPTDDLTTATPNSS
ncbi:uncharacterized protein LOC119352077 [Triticum dicoccoides]|uniref:uncharacterized protein LOC119352077 n=1 Tax=Triticum dicoccoides TaxID=85692 RepID=UPI00188F3A99|nr:uncharacterized protein LOC119352077 [Triticum dicoccoides]